MKHHDARRLPRRYPILSISLLCLAALLALPLSAQEMTPRELDQALRTGELARADEAPDELVLGGAARSGDTAAVELSVDECRSWVTIPLELVASARKLPTAPAGCAGQDHPLVALTLARPADASARALYDLLASVRGSVHALPPTQPPRPSALRSFGPIVPPLDLDGELTDGEISECTDRYLDCQFEACYHRQGLDRVVCENRCDRRFDYCIWRGEET